MCCLKYEDQAYSELKTKYPPIGSRVIYNNKQYTIIGLNVISGNLTISDGEGLTIVSSKEVKVIGSGKDNDDNNEYTEEILKIFNFKKE